MAKVAFVSHASEDAVIAASISDYLERNGVSCWLAPRDVPPGGDYAAEIVLGIETSAVFVLVLSEHANESIFVKREVERAVSKGKPIFPIRVREVLPSRSLELFIATAHWIDAWQPPIEKYLERLAQSITAAAKVYHAGPVEPVPIAPLAPPSRGKRHLALGAGALALLLLGAGGWYAYSLLRSEAHESSTAQVQPGAEPAGGQVPAPQSKVSVVRPSAPMSDLGPCPHALIINRDLPTPFSCSWGPRTASSSGAVWGTDVYTEASNLCLAALHAGVVGVDGGPVTVLRSEGRPLYIGSSRRGVASFDRGSSSASIIFDGVIPSAGPEACPQALSINRDLPSPFSCSCGPAAASSSGSVWGTDVYTEDSSLCLAAVHAGVIGRTGGPITVLRGEGRPLYVGSSRNGLASYDRGDASASITFEGITPSTGPEACPQALSINRDLPTPFSCNCGPGAAAGSGGVWGTDVYTDDSSICVAGVHAGVIGRTGGWITVLRGEGRPLYIGSSRNGVASYDRGSASASITFDGITPSAGPEACPQALSINRDLPTPFSCNCGPGFASSSGAVWGTDVYTEDSNVCLAAVHAGVIGAQGGLVTMLRGEGRDLYVGSSRNGVVSYDRGSASASIRFE